MPVVLNSTPRVGSCWLKRILEKLLGVECKPFLKENSLIFPLMKIHNEDPFLINELEFKQIILIRNIYDTIVSRIFFERRMWILEDLEELFEHKKLSPKEFINKFFEYSKDKITVWVKEAQYFINFEHPNIFKCSYEEMKNNCFDIIKQLCEYLEIKKTDIEIKNAINNCSFKNTYNKETGHENWMDYARKGIIGDYKNYFNKEQLEFIDKNKK